MAIQLVDNFRVSKQAPLDCRVVADSVSEALTKIDRLERYDGLTVYIRDEESYYRFTGGIADTDFIPVTIDRPAKRTTYIHIQGIPSKVWVINHNLDKFPSVEVVDSAGTAYEGFNKFYVDSNTIRIEFDYLLAGKAFLN